MRVALILVGTVVCGIAVWTMVGSSAGALYGALGWWALLALAWPLMVWFGVAKLDD